MDGARGEDCLQEDYGHIDVTFLNSRSLFELAYWCAFIYSSSEAVAVRTKRHLIPFYELGMMNLQRFNSALYVAAISLRMSNSWNFGREANSHAARLNSFNSILP